MVSYEWVGQVPEQLSWPQASSVASGRLEHQPLQVCTMCAAAPRLPRRLLVEMGQHGHSLCLNRVGGPWWTLNPGGAWFGTGGTPCSLGPWLRVGGTIRFRTLARDSLGAVPARCRNKLHLPSTPDRESRR